VAPCLFLSLDIKHRARGDRTTSSEARRARQALRESGDGAADADRPTLEACLQRYVEPQEVGSDTGLSCDGCGGKHPHSKREALAAVPPVLCLHIKRFTQQWRTVQQQVVHQKSDTLVEFPAEGLDLGPFTEARQLFGEAAPAAADPSSLYDLYAVSSPRPRRRRGMHRPRPPARACPAFPYPAVARMRLVHDGIVLTPRLPLSRPPLAVRRWSPTRGP